MRPLLILLALFATGLAGCTADAGPAPPPMRVLFIGNSHLAQHAVPDLVRRLAASRGQVLEVAMLAVPGTALVDHADSPALERALEQRWDWVVLQQGPSTRKRSGEVLMAGAQLLAPRLHASGARIALMSVWPPRDQRATGPSGEANYADAARAVGGCLLPAASAWRLVRLPPRRLYDADGEHATADGALLTAITITGGLLGGPGSDPQMAAQALPGRSWKATLRKLPELERAATEALSLASPACRSGAAT